MVLAEDGKVYAWGENRYGQLGDGTRIDRRQARVVEGLADVVGISAGDYHVLALTADGEVYAWGLEEWWDLGRQDPEPGSMRTRPVRVDALEDVVSISAGHGTSFASLRTGETFSWGRGYEGALGDADWPSIRETPIKVNG